MFLDSFDGKRQGVARHEEAGRKLCDCGHTKNKHGKECRVKVQLGDGSLRYCGCTTFREKR